MVATALLLLTICLAKMASGSPLIAVKLGAAGCCMTMAAGLVQSFNCHMDDIMNANNRKEFQLICDFANPIEHLVGTIVFRIQLMESLVSENELSIWLKF